MDINTLIGNEEVDNALNAPAGGEGSGLFWKIPDGKSVIRFLPRLENKVPWKSVFNHRYTPEKLMGTCLKTFGDKKCPICTKSWAMHESDLKSEKDIGYHVRSTVRYILNVYIVRDDAKPENNGTVKLLSIGKKLFELLKESYTDPDLGKKIFDITDGHDFEINKKKASDDYPDYSSSRFMVKRYRIADWSDVQDKLINIDQFVEGQRETADQLMEKFAFLGFTKKAGAPVTEKKEVVEKKESAPVVEDDSPAVGLSDEGSEDIDSMLAGL